MFERGVYHCPYCRVEVVQDYHEEGMHECPACKTRFKEIVEGKDGRVALIEEREQEIPEPLWLPKGSIRGAATISMAVACWLLIILGHDVPAYLLSLLLAVLGYYFGFRTKMKAAESRIVDAAAEAAQPLYLPSGVIRVFLIAGFVVSGVILLHRGLLADDLEYLGFFVVLGGLVVGYVFGRSLAKARGSRTVIAVNHVKGLVVLLACAVLCVFFLTQTHTQHPKAAMILCAIVTFYFGSRT